jgi:hypothetical protein
MGKDCYGITSIESHVSLSIWLGCRLFKGSSMTPVRMRCHFDNHFIPANESSSGSSNLL